MKYKIITPVSTEPILLPEAKLFLKVDVTDDDSLITGMVKSAREYCEAITGRAIAAQTIEAYLDGFPCKHEIELPHPPLVSVTSVKYKDFAGVETTMTADQYIADVDSDVGRIVLSYGKLWPSFIPYPVNPIKIRFTAGYTVVPEQIRQAMHLHFGYFYYNRDMQELSVETDKAIKNILSMFKCRWFA